MGSTWVVETRPGVSDADNWKNPDTANENIKFRTASPEEVHLNPEDLDLDYDDVQADCDNWTISTNETVASSSSGWTVQDDPS
jgi:hypothetical protein